MYDEQYFKNESDFQKIFNTRGLKFQPVFSADGRFWSVDSLARLIELGCTPDNHFSPRVPEHQEFHQKVLESREVFTQLRINIDDELSGLNLPKQVWQVITSGTFLSIELVDVNDIQSDIENHYLVFGKDLFNDIRNAKAELSKRNQALTDQWRAISWDGDSGWFKLNGEYVELNDKQEFIPFVKLTLINTNVEVDDIGNYHVYPCIFGGIPGRLYRAMEPEHMTYFVGDSKFPL